TNCSFLAVLERAQLCGFSQLYFTKTHEYTQFMDHKFHCVPPDTLHYSKRAQEISIWLPRQHLRETLSILKFLLARKNVCLLPSTPWLIENKTPIPSVRDMRIKIIRFYTYFDGGVVWAPTLAAPF
uniref:Uncharacterized protein n=1 Tax=Oryzias latipes TaxID=8090 RepID=A0A3P9IBT2_ORYLA